MQSRFTKVSPYRCGQPRFPRMDEEPANGPVVTYHLSPEEIASRYGPPVPQQQKRRLWRLTKKCLTQLLVTKTVGQIAEKYMVPQKLIFELVEKYGLKLDEKNRLKEGSVVNPAEQAKENNKFEVFEPRKTRIELAREKISKDDYLSMKDRGLTDKEIRERLDIPNDVFYTLKKEWGLTSTQNDNKSKNIADRKMTIAEAIKLREEMQKEIECNEGLMCPDVEQLTPRLAELVKKHHDECSDIIKRIDKALNNTEIAI